MTDSCRYNTGMATEFSSETPGAEMNDQLIGLARPLGLAADFSEQFGYYTKGEAWRDSGLCARRLPMVLRGHFNGNTFVSDEPLPEGLTPDRPVEIRIIDDQEEDVFKEIARMAIKAEFPPDYASQHEHYIKGTPRK